MLPDRLPGVITPYQLRDRSERLGRRDVGLAGDPRRDEAHDDRKRHGDDTSPPRDPEEPAHQHDDDRPEHHEPDREPPAGALDGIDRIGRRGAPAEQAPETREGPHHAPPVEGERGQTRRHQDRRARPHRPAGDVLVGNRRDDAGLDERRRQDAVGQQTAEQHRPAGAEAHQRAGAEQDHLGFQRQGPFGCGPPGDLQRQRDRRRDVERHPVGLRVAQPGEHRGEQRPEPEGARLARPLGGATLLCAMDGAQGRGGGGAGREGEALLINELTLDRDRREHAERRDRREPGDHARGVRAQVGHHHQRPEGRHVAAAGHVAGTGGDRRQGVVLEGAERAAHEARRAQNLEQRERQDGGGDRHPHRPAGLEEDVQVRQAHHGAERHAGDDSAHRQLRLARAVHAREPAALVVDVVGGGVGHPASCPRWASGRHSSTGDRRRRRGAAAATDPVRVENRLTAGSPWAYDTGRPVARSRRVS